MPTKGWSIRHRLMLVALAIALPFLLLTAGVVWHLAENERDTRREAILFSTRALMSAVDAILGKQIAVAEALAASPSLVADDLAGFRLEAERAAPGLSGGWIVLSDESGQQLVNLTRPSGTPLPKRNAVAIGFQKRALETGQLQISDVLLGAVLATPVVTVEVPVRRPGKPSLGLSVIMEPRIFATLFEQRALPEGWLAGLIDRQGNFVARSRDHDRMVGKPASEGFRAAARSGREGWGEFVSVEGGTIANGHVTSDLSGWVLGLAAEKSVFEAPIRTTLWVATFAGGAATLLSVLLALWAARRIARPIRQIEQSTHALAQRQSIAFTSTGVPEVDRALDAFKTAADTLEQHEKELDEREAHVHLIMRELSHRSKNLLAIARQTARHTASFEEFEARFSARIQALADAHDLLVEQQWMGATLHDLVEAQLSAFGMEKIVRSGERVLLKAEAVQNVALALHELATNAAKYGALSTPSGQVAIEWTLVPDESGGRAVRFTWRESGGPKVTPPERKGFGCFVLERVTLSALGEGRLEFAETGLIWTCLIRAEHIAPESGRASRAPGQERGRLAS